MNDKQKKFVEGFTRHETLREAVFDLLGDADIKAHAEAWEITVDECREAIYFVVKHYTFPIYQHKDAVNKLKVIQSLFVMDSNELFSMGRLANKIIENKVDQK